MQLQKENYMSHERIFELEKCHNLVDEFCFTSSEMKSYKTTLELSGMLNITNFFNRAITQCLINESVRIFCKKLKRKDFLSEHTLTPRHMSTVSEEDIAKNSQLIKNFYYSRNLISLLSELAGEKLDYLPWTGERFVLNGLINNQDTHGWHWDDYAYALVFIVNCPPKGAGGEVECIPHTKWIKPNPDIQHIIATHPIHSYYFEPGSFYLMKSDTTLHRVTQISSPYRRLSIAMSYCNQTDLVKDIDHKTVLDLYR
jgi:hypothetical protein